MKVNIGKCPPVRSKKERKVDIHIDDFDVWSADYTLAMIIVPVIKKLKELAHSFPEIDLEDLPEELKQSLKEEKDIFAKWYYILDEIIWSFEQELIEDGWETQYCSGEHDIKWIDVEDMPGCKQMVFGPNNTYKRDDEAIKAHYDRMLRGRMLFAKYYNHLWY